MTEQSATEQHVDQPTTDPMEWVRVKDLDTGNTTSIRRMSLPHGNYEVVDVDAALAGEKLADEPNPAAAAAEEATEPEWVRVKDLDTGHVSSIHRMSLPHGNYEVLEEDAVDAVTGEVAAGEHNPAAPSAEHADVDYDQLGVKELKAELARRNDGRDDDSLIAVGGPGNKPDLIAALQADDQAQAAAAAANSLSGPTPDGETPVDTTGGQ